jgi:hypothetical protein
MDWTGRLNGLDWTGLANRMDLDLLDGPREMEKGGEGRGWRGKRVEREEGGEGRGVGFEENLEARANLYKNPPRRLIRTSAWCRGVTSQQ